MGKVHICTIRRVVNKLNIFVSPAPKTRNRTPKIPPQGQPLSWLLTAWINSANFANILYKWVTQCILLYLALLVQHIFVKFIHIVASIYHSCICIGMEQFVVWINHNVFIDLLMGIWVVSSVWLSQIVLLKNFLYMSFWAFMLGYTWKWNCWAIGHRYGFLLTYLT